MLRGGLAEPPRAGRGQGLETPRRSAATRLLLGVDYASLAVQAAATAQRAETAAHTSSVNAAAYATEALRHKDAAGLSAAGAATSERNAGTSAQAAASAARTASDAQGAVAEDAQEVRRLLDGFDLEPGTVDAIPYGGTPSVSIVSGPTPGSHKLNFVLVTGPQGGKGDPGTLAANAGDLDLGGHLTATGGTFLGSAKAARERMAELADFAAHTPFQLPGIASKKSASKRTRVTRLTLLR